MPDDIDDRTLAAEPFGHMVKPFTPIDDLLLIRRDPKTTQVGAIHLSESHVKPSWRGTVVACGPGHRVGAADAKHPKDKFHCKACRETGGVIPMAVKVGQRVIVVHGAGHSIDGDDTMIVVSEGQLLGVET